MLYVILAVGACGVLRKPEPSRSRLGSATRNAAGCYRMVVGAWTSTGQPAGLIPPLEFRLDTAPNDVPASNAAGRYYSVQSIHDSRFGAKGLGGLWYLGAADSLSIRWNTGFESGGYQLELRGDSVSGTTVTWSDYRTGKPDPTARVLGTRVACAS